MAPSRKLYSSGASLTPGLSTRAVKPDYHGRRSDKTEKPVTEDDLKPYIVSFIDVLGYKQLIYKDPATSIGLLNAIIDSIEGARRNISAISSERRSLYRLSYRAFSDNIIVFHEYRPEPLTEEDARFNFFAILSVLMVQADIQTKFITEHALLTRGGAALGDFYANKDVVFGSALVEAYELEQNADTPRVLVSRELTDLFRRSARMIGHPTDSEIVKNLFCWDEDGEAYLNYLYAHNILENYLLGIRSQKNEKELMTNHHDGLMRAVEKNWSTIATKEDIRRKYVWAVRYHNKRVIRTGLGRRIDLSELPRMVISPSQGRNRMTYGPGDRMTFRPNILRDRRSETLRRE